MSNPTTNYFNRDRLENDPYQYMRDGFVIDNDGDYEHGPSIAQKFKEYERWENEYNKFWDAPSQNLNKTWSVPKQDEKPVESPPKITTSPKNDYNSFILCECNGGEYIPTGREYLSEFCPCGRTRWDEYDKKENYNNRFIKLLEYKTIRIVISTDEDNVGIVIGKQYRTLNRLKTEYNVDITFKKANRIFSKPAFIISSLGKDSINIIQCANAINRLIGIATRFPKPESNPETPANPVRSKYPSIGDPPKFNLDFHNVWGSNECVNATDPWYSK